MNKLSIIWDMTPVCPFHCPICCMGAKPSRSSSDEELDYGTKYAVVGQIRQLSRHQEISIDLSGGEIMTDPRNLKIAEELSSIVKKENLGISTSGYHIDEKVAFQLSQIVGEVELTMDTPPGVPYRLRPLSYAKAAARAVPLLKKNGISTGIQTVLAKSNSTAENLTALYHWLCEHNVDTWSLLRFYPSGRGADYPEECLSQKELHQVIHLIQELDEQNTSLQKPRLHFHYTMKGHKDYSSECRCVKKSIGIFPNGDVTACFWASDRDTQITDDRFYLGNIRESTLVDILAGPRSCYWKDQPHSCPLLFEKKEDNHVSDIEYHNCIA